MASHGESQGTCRTTAATLPGRRAPLADDPEDPIAAAQARAREGLASERARAAAGGPGYAPSRIPRCTPPREEGSPVPDSAVAYASARALLDHGDLEEAEAELRLAIARDDTHPAAWRELGMLLVDLGRHDEADRPLATARRLDPDDHEVIRYEAVARERRGDLEAAAARYREFLERCPEDHQRPRLHASRRVEALERDPESVRPPDADAVEGVEELDPEEHARSKPLVPAWWGGVAAVLLLLYGLLPGAPAPGARRPAGDRERSFAARAAEVLREGPDRAGLSAALSAASTSALGPGDALLDEALAALLEEDSLAATRALVQSYLVAARPERFGRSRALLRRLAPALKEVAPDLLEEVLAEERARYRRLSGAADQRVVRALDALARDLGVPLEADAGP